MTKRLLILGAGGHGKVVADCAHMSGKYAEIAFLDVKFGELDKNGSWDILGKPEDALKFNDGQTEFFVAVGVNKVRGQLIEFILECGLTLACVVHPSAQISQQASIGKGTLVCANASINISSELGIGCIVNTNASVDHDCSLGDYVHIAPGVNVAGTVAIGQYCFLGIGSAVIPNLTIGEYTVVGAGATVVSDLPPKVVVTGTPAKVL